VEGNPFYETDKRKTEEERMLVELRVKLARAIRRRREQSNLSQKQVATRIKSSQPRVAKIEAASPDVSLDLSIRALFAAGGELSDLTGTGRPRNRARASERSGRRGTATGPPRSWCGTGSRSGTPPASDVSFPPGPDR